MPGTTGGRIRLVELNDQLTCKLCKGYFIDATTIVECLHSFCKSCIVKYLKTNKYCPICEVLVHECKPLLGIKPDYTLQDIVYKLVPSCYQNEMRCRREFYDKYPEAKIAGMSPEARGEPIESHIYSADELLNLSLEYYNPTYIKTINIIPTLKEPSESEFNSEKSLSKIYLRCPAAVTVYHLQKLIRAKYELSDAYRIDFMYKEEPLCTNYTLMDVMYIYHWRRKVPLNLNYRIFKPYPERLASSDGDLNSKENEEIENECKKSNITKDSKNQLPQKNSSDKNLNAAIDNAPMVTDTSNESQSERNSINTTSTSDLNSSKSNAEQKLVTTITMTTLTTMTTTTSTSLITTTTTTTQINEPSSSINTSFISNNTQTSIPNNNDNNNNNNNSNSGVNSDRSNSSPTPENSKVNSKVNSSTVLPQLNTNTSAILKPIVKKIEILPKGMTLNKICTKINNSGSKINDICSKIRNFSKKKSKIEKTKSGVPTLLKVTKKSVTSTPDDVVNRISTVLVGSSHSVNQSTNNEQETESLPTTVTSSISTTVKESGLLVSDQLSKTPEIQPHDQFQSSSGMISSSGSIQMNSTVESQSLLDVSPNTSGVNESSSGVKKKPPIAKPPRLSKLKSLPKHQGTREISIKPLLSKNDKMKNNRNSLSRVLAAPNKIVTPSGLSSMSKYSQAHLSINSHSSSYSPQGSYHHLPFIPISCSPSYPINSSAFMVSPNPFISTSIPNLNLRPMYSQLPSPGYTNDAQTYSNSLIGSTVQVPTSNAIKINVLPSPRNIKPSVNNISSTATVHYRPGLTIRPVYSSPQVSSIINYAPLSMSTTSVSNLTPSVNRVLAPSTSLENNKNSNEGKSQNSNVFNFLMTPTTDNYTADFSRSCKSSPNFGNSPIYPAPFINPIKLYESDTKIQGKTTKKVEKRKKKNKNQELGVICSKEIEKKSEEEKKDRINNSSDEQVMQDKLEKVDEKLNECSSEIENTKTENNEETDAALSRNDAETELKK